MRAATIKAPGQTWVRLHPAVQPCGEPLRRSIQPQFCCLWPSRCTRLGRGQLQAWEARACGPRPGPSRCHSRCPAARWVCCVARLLYGGDWKVACRRESINWGFGSGVECYPPPNPNRIWGLSTCRAQAQMIVAQHPPLAAGCWVHWPWFTGYPFALRHTRAAPPAGRLRPNPACWKLR